jgi:hypothetical protein
MRTISTGWSASHCRVCRSPSSVLAKLITATLAPKPSTRPTVMLFLCGSIPPTAFCTCFLSAGVTMDSSGGISAAMLGSAGQAPFRPAPIPPR